MPQGKKRDLQVIHLRSKLQLLLETALSLVCVKAATLPVPAAAVTYQLITQSQHKPLGCKALKDRGQRGSRCSMPTFIHTHLKGLCSFCFHLHALSFRFLNYAVQQELLLAMRVSSSLDSSSFSKTNQLSYQNSSFSPLWKHFIQLACDSGIRHFSKTKQEWNYS